MRKLIGNVRKSTPWQSLLLLLVLTLCLFPSSALGDSYSYTDIHPPGRIESRVPCLNGRGGAGWINDAGESAGTMVKDAVRHAFVLRGQSYSDPTPGWGYSEATYVGEDGAIGGNGEVGGR